ncbi:thiamine-phosphate kinase [Caldivirga maquilingensis]|uniref:Thiamine-monophosphate kinase n=1 Tax=Caldivirga maquilingensis (strain ATCC 700844 / DSM 13496 / JCM 10307 / IC-167) TaxID=397948 RepID=A8M9Z8_CALMQ|nr:thiamine-phosphate kinase [Caldivirga maquilingensis]ABW02469.1 thiamine monophosphate kinase-like protein [Caldivirga maquilingensis IC-167]
MLRELGEDKLINIMQSLIELKYPNADNDVSYVELPNVGLLTLKIDGGSLSRTKTDFMTYYDVGWRMTIGAASDLLVKFAKPIALVTSLTLRGDHTESELEELIKGINDAAKAIGASYIGGDLNEGDDDVLDVALIGIAGKPIGRVPRLGDVLVTIPEFGFTGLIFKLWYSGLLSNYINDSIVVKGIELTRRPKPWIPSGELGNRINCVNASMDSSDGLGRVLYEMGKGVRIRVYSLPVNKDVESTCRRYGLSVEEVVFNGGEEYLPVLAVKPECLDYFKALGFVDFAKVEEGNGVYLDSRELKHRGWVYFTKPNY